MKILLDVENNNLCLNFPDMLTSLKITDGELSVLLNSINLVSKQATIRLKKELQQKIKGDEK